ncbi:MAG TPA: copper amine oxidase N-terminal domain-containing protein [Chthonomonadaceae bacterium]|nr:copper amine oxidase N-terminal domain-containing protein [Chthonomonadaceae bacterium]
MRHANLALYRRAIGSMALAGMMTAALISGAGAQMRTVSLSSGTVIPVKLNTTLSSQNAQQGDTFTATVPDDQANDYNLPVGTEVEGVVRDVRPQEGNNPGLLDLGFTEIRLPDGRTQSIQGSLIGLDTSSVTHTRDGRLIAKPDKQNKRLVYAGYGAGAGLIVGLLTHHTLEDALIGGGLGYLFSSLQHSNSNARDVVLKSGTELGVRLDRRVAFNDNPDNNYYNNSYGNDNGSYQYREQGSFHRSPAYQGAMGNNSGIGVMVGDQNVSFRRGAWPLMWQGHVMAPAAPVLDAAGVNYTFDSGRRSITAHGPNGDVRMTAGSRVAVVNGYRRVLLDNPARWMNGTLYVPSRFFGFATGQPVRWDSGSQTVIINQ